MSSIMPRIALFLICVAWLSLSEMKPGFAQASSSAQNRMKVIIDTDIGDDIDDAFALALALRSPELEILGVTTTFGDTETRAKLVDRFLSEAGRPEIPVAAGTPTPAKSRLNQRPY